MKSWNCLNTKTIYQLIPEHISSGKYTDLVDQLLAEELATGKIGLSSLSECSYWRVSGHRIKASYEDRKEKHAIVVKKIKNLQEDLKSSTKHQEKRKEYQSLLDTYYMEKFDLEKKKSHDELFLQQLETLDSEMSKFYISLGVVLREYSQTHDKDYLHKGVDLLSSIREEHIQSLEEDVRQKFILEEIGDCAEFRRLFALEEIPLYQLYHLYEIYKRYSQNVESTKFLTEAALYYSNQLTQVGNYLSPLSASQDNTIGLTNEVSWRKDDSSPEENAT